MSFNSFEFVAFFLFTYGLYLVSRHRVQNYLLLAASYFFYGYWDWRFLGLLLASTLLDYVTSLGIERSSSAAGRKAYLLASVIGNLGMLGAFKYFNFFADSLVRLLGLLGLHADAVTVSIVLPVGISFYTFQTMSYTIDVYLRRIAAVRNFTDFALFVTFFPQLVAGPIERAGDLLSQVQVPRRVTARDVQVGIYFLLWGYYKKLFVGDNAGAIAGLILGGGSSSHGLEIGVGLLAFAFQIYGDFSGYSDIARGLARLMGFRLSANFRLPYFAASPREFWMRWHITLSTWLRDYLYVPLGGNRRGEGRMYVNLMLTMFLGGLWHGASWHFVLWGTYHGLLLVGYRAVAGPGGERPSRSRLRRAGAVALMFGFTLFGWLLFRAVSVAHIGELVSNLSTMGVGRSVELAGRLALCIVPLLAIELVQEIKGNALVVLSWPVWARTATYVVLFYSMVVFAPSQSPGFIYFQF